MIFDVKHLSKNTQSLLGDVLLHCAVALLVVLLFSYGLLTFKIRLQTQQVKVVDNSAASTNVIQEKEDEKKVATYQKKIEQYKGLFAEHTAIVALFDFVEKNTLPSVWFSNFDFSGSANTMTLSGEAETMEVLSRQVQVFEQAQYISATNILNSEFDPSGKVRFILGFSFKDNVFTYAHEQQ